MSSSTDCLVMALQSGALEPRWGWQGRASAKAAGEANSEQESETNEDGPNSRTSSLPITSGEHHHGSPFLLITEIYRLPTPALFMGAKEIHGPVYHLMPQCAAVK